MKTFITMKNWQLFAIFVASVMLEFALQSIDIFFNGTISALLIIAWIYSIILNTTEKYKISLKCTYLAITIYLTYSTVFQVVPTIHAILGVWILALVMKTSMVISSLNFKKPITNFMLLIFFPIGVWFLQPQINRLANK